VRVALFTNNYLPFCGGVTISVETLRRGLEAAGHEAWVFAPRFPNATDVGSRIVRYPSLPAVTYPEFALAVPWAPRIARRGAALSFAVSPAHPRARRGPAAGGRARRQGRPLVFTYHTRYEKYAHYVPVTRALVERAAVRLSTRFAARADAVLAPSAILRDELRARGVRTPIAVVPTGVDVARFRPGGREGARRALEIAAEERIVLYVGRLDREKSVDRILTAFERVAGTVPGTRLLLVGHGTQTEQLRRQAQASAAGARVRFDGVQPHAGLPRYYRAADVFVFASETETQGLVLAEAAACGLPAVAVSAPGCDEVVRDGETGLLTKVDAAALADAVIGLLLDADRRAAMAARAREVAAQAFDVRLQIERTLAVYAEAIAAAGRAGR
jgi:glycosyltransferase involved in cell wall biosynthesis